MLTCFSGGVFLATCFLHLFPELSDHLNYMRQEYDFDFDYPLAELLSCMGFFVLFFLEEAVLYLVPSMAHGHGHIHGTHGHSHE
jgi:zinc transporter 1/2/3